MTTSMPFMPNYFRNRAANGDIIRKVFEVFKSSQGNSRVYNSSKYVRMFSLVAHRLYRWKKSGLSIPPLRKYVETHFKKLVKSKDLDKFYPEHLLYRDSYKFFYGNKTVDPEMVDSVDTTGFTEAEMKEANNFVMDKLVRIPKPEWKGIFDD